ncbi:MAG TPA: hypothetical protein VG407_05910 [Caulobacteraceae bacterium]|jgi:hypothetical protein|nr:hypothetical protein [Caulobacteraceae bacterium]
MSKLQTLGIAASFWAVAVSAPQAQAAPAATVEDPSMRLYTVQFRSRLDHHGRLLSMRIVKVIDGKTGKSVRLKISRQFIAVAKARIEQDLAKPHDAPTPAELYSAFQYAPDFPDVLFVDPPRTEPVAQSAPSPGPTPRPRGRVQLELPF